MKKIIIVLIINCSLFINNSAYAQKYYSLVDTTDFTLRFRYLTGKAERKNFN